MPGGDSGEVNGDVGDFGEMYEGHMTPEVLHQVQEFVRKLLVVCGGVEPDLQEGPATPVTSRNATQAEKVKKGSGEDEMAVLYIVFVLLFFATSLVVLLVRHVRRERESLRLEKFYHDYLGQNHTTPSPVVYFDERGRRLEAGALHGSLRSSFVPSVHAEPTPSPTPSPSLSSTPPSTFRLTLTESPTTPPVAHPIGNTSTGVLAVLVQPGAAAVATCVAVLPSDTTPSADNTTSADITVHDATMPSDTSGSSNAETPSRAIHPPEATTPDTARRAPPARKLSGRPTSV